MRAEMCYELSRRCNERSEAFIYHPFSQPIHLEEKLKVYLQSTHCLIKTLITLGSSPGLGVTPGTEILLTNIEFVFVFLHVSVLIC